MNSLGAVKVFGEEMMTYEIELAVLQEISWPGVGKLRVENGSILYSGKENVRAEGVGFFLSSRAEAALIEFAPVSSRIAKIRLRTQWFNMTIVCAHAHTEVTDGDTKDGWCTADRRLQC